MKKVALTILAAVFVLLAPSLALAEAKPLWDDAPGQTIPKITPTPNDPVLYEGHVYPFWGPVCQRYTYSVIYQDKEGRPPEYVRIYFNGDWIDIEKENPEDNNYEKGVKYIYEFVPQKLRSNFYFFEASNGQGKARDSIIDSPDNGPVLFESAFDQNEIVLIDPASGNVIWRYPVAKEWVGGVALSQDGQYLAVQTSGGIRLFETKSAQPKWTYQSGIGMAQGDVKGGIDISQDGSLIFAAFGDQKILFNKNSNKPIWQYSGGENAYNVAIASNGEYVAAATAGEADNPDSNLLILWSVENKEPLWQYHASGNFHDVSLSSDGSFITGATGCPDRRAYIFAKNSNDPLMRSEMLTRDSPVDQAKISADGSLAAFGAESDSGAVFLFNRESNQSLWKFTAPQEQSFRALGLTPDGRFIGAATFGGHAYIFSKDSNQPISSWQVSASLGTMDIADDGSFIAVGGTDQKVHIFEKNSLAPRAEIELNEYVGELDISGNSQYLAAGTSGSVYFFETLIGKDENYIFSCDQIIEPPPEEEMINRAERRDEIGSQNILFLFFQKKGIWLSIVFGAVLILTLVLFWKFKKRWIWLIGGIILIGIIASGVMVFVNFKKDLVPVVDQDQIPEDSSDLDISDREPSLPSGEAVCGNNICEPD